MEIIRDLEQLKPLTAPTIATLGNFDGVHIGHREIFRGVVRKARETGGTAVVVTFVPHPLKVLMPERAPRLLNTYAEKERLIAASCIDLLVQVPFDETMATCPAAEFVKRVLVDGLRIRHLIVGYDYAFGYRRSGDVELLRRLGDEYGFTVETVQPVCHEGAAFSSTRVRHLLAAGDVSGVVPLLGRHFTLEGEVVRGASRGHRLGFPTANLTTEKEILPRPGVYAVKAKLDDSYFDAVMNIGFNPTFGLERISLEVHLLDFARDIYGRQLRVYFVERLRDEMVFSSIEDLVAQIDRDVASTRSILQDCDIIEYREYLDCGFQPGDS
ncbi:MAG: riboflavin biosynthesis protein RibF [Desulfuromonas sp.]|nr:MAG: riboflavin biosynthesis protein RibF [Desulfuromonas sp.]